MTDDEKPRHASVINDILIALAEVVEFDASLPFAHSGNDDDGFNGKPVTDPGALFVYGYVQDEKYLWEETIVLRTSLAELVQDFAENFLPINPEKLAPEIAETFPPFDPVEYAAARISGKNAVITKKLRDELIRLATYLDELIEKDEPKC
jgi:hypothetical protein